MPHTHGHHDHTRHHGGGHIGAAFFLNLSFTVVELVGGLFTNSVAILSDAAHDFGDSLSLGLAWYFQKRARKGSNKQYPYGYTRVSLLGAIINAVVLSVGSVYILTEAVPRIFTPQETNAGGMFLLAVIGILVNGAAALRTRKGASVNEKVVSLHLLEDVLGWAAVLVGSAVIHFTGLTVIDPILSVVIAVFVLTNVFRNIRQVLPILLQGTPAELDREEIAAKLTALRQVSALHDLHIWSLDEETVILTVHLVLAEVLPPDGLAALKGTVRALLAELGAEHATIEFETPGEDCTLASCI
ncbi:MAG: cation diffusion facilitator family transporter [Oscillospiraceae bacterium]|jgi:cobalt-zinc-cadmium efflux system protein|nr:cation diffusion facilitator family transporter [Oscillospiraceae bacterium]